MRVALLTLLSLILFLTTSQAQHIRLGHRIPEIDVESRFGEELKLIKHDYVCLIFVHSESQPCIDALTKFKSTGDHLSERLAIVLITAENNYKENSILAGFTDETISIAYDDEYRTFCNFDVEYVPFAVIYDSKRRRTQWSGSLIQLEQEVLDSIIHKPIK